MAGRRQARARRLALRLFTLPVSSSITVVIPFTWLFLVCVAWSLSIAICLVYPVPFGFYTPALSVAGQAESLLARGFPSLSTGQIL